MNNNPFVLILTLLFFVNPLFSQKILIQGKVISSEKGRPLYGVTVQVKGTSKGTVTDNFGKYQIEIKQNFYNPSKSPEKLVFTYLVYKK